MLSAVEDPLFDSHQMSSPNRPEEIEEMKTLWRQLFLWSSLMLGVCGHARAVDLPVSTAKPLMQAQRVVRDVYYVQGLSEMGSSANQNFISNAGFIVTPQGVVVVDALGSPELARRLVSEIAKVTRQPIHTVIVTHYHADHIYGLQVFKELGRASWHTRQRVTT